LTLQVLNIQFMFFLSASPLFLIPLRLWGLLLNKENLSNDLVRM
jgi:hypothetical protein